MCLCIDGELDFRPSSSTYVRDSMRMTMTGNQLKTEIYTSGQVMAHHVMVGFWNTILCPLSCPWLLSFPGAPSPGSLSADVGSENDQIIEFNELRLHHDHLVVLDHDERAPKRYLGLDAHSIVAHTTSNSLIA